MDLLSSDEFKTEMDKFMDLVLHGENNEENWGKITSTILTSNFEILFADYHGKNNVFIEIILRKPDIAERIFRRFVNTFDAIIVRNRHTYYIAAIKTNNTPLLYLFIEYLWVDQYDQITILLEAIKMEKWDALGILFLNTLHGISFDRLLSDISDHVSDEQIPTVAKIFFSNSVGEDEMKTFSQCVLGLLDHVVERQIKNKQKRYFSQILEKSKSSYQMCEKIEYFRSECLSHINTRAEDIRLNPESMQVKLAGFRVIMTAKIGHSDFRNMYVEERDYLYGLVSNNQKFCDYYSILVPSDLSRVF